MCLHPECQATDCPGCQVSAPIDAQLDPGIADVVIMLRNLGFNPTDSGDGRSKPDEERDFDVKHVACTVDEAKLFNEARRLHQVLGWGWKVEASFEPSAGGSCILLATKLDPPGPRHQHALAGFLTAAQRFHASNDADREFLRAAEIVYDALQHELGRR